MCTLYFISLHYSKEMAYVEKRCLEIHVYFVWFYHDSGISKFMGKLGISFSYLLS